MSREKIVITGMGAVTPIGTGVKKFWENMMNGVCGISRIARFNTDELAVKIGAEVKDFEPTDYIPKKLVREMDLFMQYAYAAADEALTDSGMEIEPARTGIVMATAMGGTGAIADAQMAMEASSRKSVSPKFVPKILGNVSAAQIAIAKNIKGPSLTVSTACSSGGDAILMGAMLINSGMCDSVLVVAGEASICPLVYQSLAAAHALSRNNEEPEKACRPFDVARDGFIMGEGGGALLLETEAHAKAREAKIYAELAGYANNEDAYHVTAPNPEGTGAAECMRLAMACADVTPEQIGYINMHGTSTPAGDIAETKAIKMVFREKVKDLCVSSTKSSTGHMMAAGGIVEVISCILAINNEVLPATINLENQDEACDLDCIPNKPRQKVVEYAMSNSLGFGGQNSSIIVKKYN